MLNACEKAIFLKICVARLVQQPPARRRRLARHHALLSLLRAYFFCAFTLTYFWREICVFCCCSGGYYYIQCEISTTWRGTLQTFCRKEEKRRRRVQVKASTRHPILSHIKSNSAFRKEEKLSPQILYFVC